MTVKQVNGSRVVYEEFSNLDMFLKGVGRETNVVFKNARHASDERGRTEWAGTASFNDAVSLLSNGWTDKLAEIRKEMAQFDRVMEQNVTYQKKRPSTSVVGFAPHVPNAIMGLPNSMIRTEHTPMKTKVVRIIYNMCMNSGTDADDIMNAGLAVLKIANALERKGMRVRVDVNPFLAERNREKVCALVCIKDWRQPIDLKKIAFPVAHPSMFRRIGFRWLETVPELKEQGFTSGYGRSLEEEDACASLLEAVGARTEKDYFVNVRIARRCGYDVNKLAQEIGLGSL